MLHQKYKEMPFYLKLASVAVSILAFGYLASIGQTIFVPLILGSLFALLLVPVCGFLERRLRLPRTLATIVTVTLFFGGGFYFIYLLASQLSMLKEDWPAFYQQLLHTLDMIQEWIDTTFGINSKEQIKILNDTASSSFGQGTMILGVALMSLSSFTIFLVFLFLYTFFVLLYRSHIVKFFLLLNHSHHHDTVLDIISQVKYVVKRYLIGLAIQMLLVSGMVTAALMIIDVKYSFLLGVITGVFNVLPYVGILISLLLISLIAFATAGVTKVLLVILALVVIHAIDGNYIVPKVVGSKVQVNSLFALLAIIVGEMLWGISGMFLAIPILAIAKIIFDRVDDLKAWGFLLGEEGVDTTKEEIASEEMIQLRPPEEEIPS